MPAVSSYREAGDRSERRCPTASGRGSSMSRSAIPKGASAPEGDASPFDAMRLLPLEVGGDCETWLCAPEEVRGGLECWPVDIDDDGDSFDDTESVSSVSVECGEFEHLMDIASWDGPGSDGEDDQLVFPMDCSSDDMVWLLGGSEDRPRAPGSNVDLLFPAGCSDMDKDWLTRAASLSDMDWLVPAQDGQKFLDSQESF
ncbi:unnamed protein product [Ostreobium quekettii]|uniref:Uncharacterized protein n=1 Tax=Ostreobium quekettii TaxID=121088 RepID=A0A8S1JAG5_9CHLO|nr:unnamed protein product [Ostreobium quekettii]|eukprot:evm.model.scf_1834EXC.4 EVM.evm.TU.scf_1834EXC.4   scf_1834EXC:23152-24273(-)